MTKVLMDKLMKILFLDTTYSSKHNIYVILRYDYDSLNLKIVQTFMSLMR